MKADPSLSRVLPCAGLSLIPGFITMDDERRLLDWLNSRSWSGDLERRTQQVRPVGQGYP